ncbi:MAG TPA: helix-turn-helix domain-containing protein [Solirubrobacterales bacterium]|nr:helix-turn-helix domain-containing protein [Solirubrobacterales bacterium]
MDAGRQGPPLDSLQPELTSDFARLARALGARLDELSATTVERLQGELPAWVLEEAVGEQVLATFVRESLAAQLRSLSLRFLPGECPPIDAHAARAAARLGDLRMLLGGYRIAHMVLWEGWLAQVRESDVGEETRYELLRLGSRFFFRYAAVLGDHVSAGYQAELERSLRSGEQRRFEAVKAVLEGAATAGEGLDVNLEQHHLGLVAWGADGQEAARELAAALGRRLLSVSPFGHVWWGWLSGSQSLGLVVEDAVSSLPPPPEGGLAVGLEAFGEEGFRVTHRQAQRARRVASRLGRSVVAYADVVVEALLGDDEAEARAFVVHELRGIADDSATSRRIRETIAAYFAAEHNAASAAAALGIHQQTVANRLRAAEERLGHPVSSRRVELEAALRLRAGLDL